MLLHAARGRPLRCRPSSGSRSATAGCTPLLPLHHPGGGARLACLGRSGANCGALPRPAAGQPRRQHPPAQPRARCLGQVAAGDDAAHKVALVDHHDVPAAYFTRVRPPMQATHQGGCTLQRSAAQQSSRSAGPPPPSPEGQADKHRVHTHGGCRQPHCDGCLVQEGVKVEVRRYVLQGAPAAKAPA